ncbi:MAG: hypothetical protein E5V92_12935 [Mesorhizobium sp.]|uniref:hypothetical protein n=1 Tax=unclassified Mesorhizobium TaxID=325217 RepID=UPI000F7656E1|nr:MULTISPECIES: hypothetical protein [unclassified Mesorhizobium]AZO71927.1 hypothetical protein EJ067_12900 [Mesorhizobium sp. M1D.F.Ca.ET.043.01.1.1]RWA94709.1 MAG: hypothetical protein EOQ32_09435 [Mesorhizobium sp.]TJW86665.1 MAG: hypothetical protein E5V92_12935 [Mesorhizobium sp.]
MAEFFISSLIGQPRPFCFDVVKASSDLISGFPQVGTLAQSIGPAPKAIPGKVVSGFPCGIASNKKMERLAVSMKR